MKTNSRHGMACTAALIAWLTFPHHGLAELFKVIGLSPNTPQSGASETNAVWVRQSLGGGIAIISRALSTNDVWADTDPGKAVSLVTTPDMEGTEAHITASLANVTVDSRVLRNGRLWLGRVDEANSWRFFVERGRLLWTKKGEERDLREVRGFLSQLRTPHSVAASINTEYAVEVDEDQTTFTLLEGSINLTFPSNSVFVTNFVNAITNEPLVIRVSSDRIVRATNQPVQWWLYYPAVLVSEDLPVVLRESPDYSRSIAAYEVGDIRQALAALNPTPDLSIPGAREYMAALRVTEGETGMAEALLAGGTVDERLAGAVRTLVAAVTHRPWSPVDAASASEHLARSWWYQSQWRLDLALREAHSAMNRTPGGLTWARVAQLEFAVGNLHSAELATASALRFATNLASAWTVQGFLAAAANRLEDAEGHFQHAIQLDFQHADAWFGRGLVRYRRGQTAEAQNDLRVAARLQRDRALFRAYLGRMLLQDGVSTAGIEELDLATQLDRDDPTGWWFSALENYRTNRVNHAVELVGKALDRNDNRAVHRSRRLLDMDRAVRRSGLARVFERAGMPELAIREAASAVAADPASHSAHLFLAESYGALRDPTRFGHRYDTLWLNELLLANLFAPVGAGPLSAGITQEEYGRLFDQDGFRLASQFEVRSDAQFRGVLSQSGVSGSSSYALDLDWQHNDAQSYRQELDRWEGAVQVKHQFGLQDTGILWLWFRDFAAGDNFQRYDPGTSPQDSLYQEWQRPTAIGLWRHEWSAQSQTLALFGRLENEQQISVLSLTNQIWRLNNGSWVRLNESGGLQYASDFETYVGEAAQLFELGDHFFTVGIRGHAGDLSASSSQVLDHVGTNIVSSTEGTLERLSLYAYDRWRIADDLTVIGGVAYDQIETPANFRRAPVANGSHEEAGVLPKAGLLWQPIRHVGIRGAYAHSLTGISYDESIRLEPSQLAGISQTYRSLMPVSEVGPVEGHRFSSYGVAIDVTISKRAYAGLHWLGANSSATRDTGYLELIPIDQNSRYSSFQAEETLDYREHTVGGWVGALLGDDAFATLTYDYELAELDRGVPRLGPRSFSHRESSLHRLGLHLGANFASGLFWRIDSQFFWQESLGAIASRQSASDNSNQTDLTLGWRFPNQRGEFACGVLNFFGKDYRLDPLNSEPERARERVAFARLRFKLGPCATTR